MARNVSVSDDVYELLRRGKLPGESFSDLIRRGLKRSARLSDIKGSRTINKSDWIRVQKHIRESEEVTRKKLGRMFRC
ncbi:MAG TPA: antitoxin VapB family protein [Candidatus Bathyarchaeia archaeon]|nr:antitoxin VapB family protein [Candidatus Bathyarchaeia archaeon]